MEAGRIEIPGSLPSERRRREHSDSASGEQTPENGEESDIPADGVSDSAGTDSEEFQSDLDPDLDRPHRAEGGERKPRRKRQQQQQQTPEQQLARSQKLAARFAARGCANNAMRQLVRQTALSVLVFGPNHCRYASSYAQLAKGYLDLKGAAYALQAAEHAEHAKNILLSLQSGSSSAASSEAERLELLKISLAAFHTLGRAQSLMKKFQDAERSLLKAEEIVKQMSKLQAADYDFLQESRIKVWTALAKISHKVGKPAVSVSYFEQALADSKKRHGSTAPELVPLYQGIGNVEQSRAEFANHDRAIDMYLKAHEIATAQGGGEFSESAAGTARALSAAYARCGSGVAEASAESYLQESLAAYLQLYGPEHATVCEVQDEMAKLMIRAERHEEGAKLLQDTLRVKAKVFGDYSPEVLESYRMLGSLHLSQGRMQRALADLQRACDIAEFLHGPGSRASKETQSLIQTVLKHPSMEGKQAGYDMKNRPRFSGIVGRSKPAAAAAAAAGSGVFN